MKLTILLTALLLCLPIFAQDPKADREIGIQAYKNGDYQNAVISLEKYTDKKGKDVVALYYLAQSFEKLNNTEKAKEGFRKSAEKSYGLLEDKVAKGLLDTKKTSKNGGLKGWLQVEIGEEIEAGLESIKSMKRLDPQKAAKSDWDTAELIFATFSKTTDLFANSDDKKDSDYKKPEILNKPRPSYTDQARKAGVSGRTKVFVMLLPNGQIGFVVSLFRLSEGLTEESIKAAKQVKFRPAQIGSRPVTTFVQLEYSFDLY